jgi:hypothetical protein
VAKFYSARSKTIPPLPWQTFALPFSAVHLVAGFVSLAVVLALIPAWAATRRPLLTDLRT